MTTIYLLKNITVIKLKLINCKKIDYKEVINHYYTYSYLYEQNFSLFVSIRWSLQIIYTFTQPYILFWLERDFLENLFYVS